MRSVIRLRSRPGRPWWQLTTRPSTAVVLGLVSVAAAVVQIALLSSPPPWYQLVVAGFWSVIGLAFLGSAVGTRVRARREAVVRARRPVAAEPFVPVPVVPARRRRDPARDGAGGASAHDGAGGDAAREADTGTPTADLTDAVPTTVNPVVTAVVPGPVPGPVPAPVAATGSGLALAARLAAPSPPPAPAVVAAASDDAAAAPAAVADPGEPTTRLPREPGPGTRDRHAVRAVLSAEFAAQALEEESERMVAGRTPLRDGRVRSAHGATAPSRGSGRRAGRDEDAAASDEAVPQPRETAEEPTSSTRTGSPPAHTPTGSTPTRTSHRRGRKRRGAESPVPPSRRPVDVPPGGPEDTVPRPRQAPERATARSVTPEAATGPHPAVPHPAVPRPAVDPRPATGPHPAGEHPAGEHGRRTAPATTSGLPARPTTATSAARTGGLATPPSLPVVVPRERTSPASALTFGTPDTAVPAPAGRRTDPRTAEPSHPRPYDAGRHARVEVTDRAHQEPRSARHAATDGRR